MVGQFFAYINWAVPKGSDTKKRAILLNFHFKINFFCVSGKFEGMRDFLSQKIQVKEKSYFLDSIIQKLSV